MSDDTADHRSCDDCRSRYPASAYAPPPGFVSRMLESTPRFVMGLIGSFLGIAISGGIILKMGGLDGVVLRMANAYAAGLEVQMMMLSRETAKLSTITSRIEEIGASLDAIQSRIVAVEGSTARAIVAVEAKTMGAVATISHKVDAIVYMVETHDRKDVARDARIDDTAIRVDALSAAACAEVRPGVRRPDFCRR